MHLGYSPSEVIRAVGKPDEEDFVVPKGRQSSVTWIWGKANMPDLPILQVDFESSQVVNVCGTSLSVGSKDYGLDAGRPLTAATFLGTPIRSEKIHWLGDMRTDLFTTWSFPEVKITVLSDDTISRVRIENPGRL